MKIPQGKLKVEIINGYNVGLSGYVDGYCLHEDIILAVVVCENGEIIQTEIGFLEASLGKRIKPDLKNKCPYEQIVSLYHEKLPMCPKVVTLSEKRKASLRARWANGMNGMENWILYFEDVAKSRWLTGKVPPSQGRKQFIADFDFLIRESTIIKTQEGKYHG